MDKGKVVKQQESNGKLRGGVTGKGFKPGQSGNPNGRPKKEFCVPDILRERGKDIDPLTKKTYYEAMCTKAWELAAKGDKAARDWVTDRTEGRALERIDQTTRLEPFKLIER